MTGPIENRKSKIENALLHPWTLRISRWLLAAVMIGAAIPKLADPPGFAQGIFAYRILPMAAVLPLALMLPWLELLTALALALGLAQRSAAGLILAMMLAFSAGLGLNLARGNPVDCGCFGPSKVVKTKDQRLFDMKLAILRDLGLAVLAAHAIWGAGRRG
jgi:uncharacterized membrane protein YphA (DoxX/SURF4 family)